MATALPGPDSIAAMSMIFFVRAVSGSCPRWSVPAPPPVRTDFIDSTRSSSARPSETSRWAAPHAGIAMIDRKMCSAPMWS